MMKEDDDDDVDDADVGGGDGGDIAVITSAVREGPLTWVNQIFTAHPPIMGIPTFSMESKLANQNPSQVKRDNVGIFPTWPSPTPPFWKI